MSDVQEIANAIAMLPPDDFLRLRELVQKRFEDQWDKDFEQDVASGRLEEIANKALAEHRAGRSTPFPQLRFDDKYACLH
jgi:hypothetical protein